MYRIRNHIINNTYNINFNIKYNLINSRHIIYKKLTSTNNNLLIIGVREWNNLGKV